jgi:hypothetical protein
MMDPAATVSTDSRPLAHPRCQGAVRVLRQAKALPIWAMTTVTPPSCMGTGCDGATSSGKGPSTRPRQGTRPLLGAPCGKHAQLVKSHAVEATPKPPPRPPERSQWSRRVGYVAAIAINAVFLYLVHQLRASDWPAFLTEDFDTLVPLISLSLIATMAANALFWWRDPGWLKATGDAVTAAVGFVVAIRVYQVFPFDFSAYAVDWSGLVRLLVILSIVGTAIGCVANLVKALSAIARPR